MVQRVGVQVAASHVVLAFVARPSRRPRTHLAIVLTRRGWISASTGEQFCGSPGVVAALWLVLFVHLDLHPGASGYTTETSSGFLVIIEYGCAVLGFSLSGASLKVAISHPVGTGGISHVVGSIPFVRSRVSGALSAGSGTRRVLFFWGWDTAVNLNEESKEFLKDSGSRPAWISMFSLLLDQSFVLNIRRRLQMWGFPTIQFSSMYKLGPM